MDKSAFTGIPCAAPCWHGLEVGRSNEKDSIAALSDLAFIDQKSAQIYQMESLPDYYVKLSGPGVKIVANCANFAGECLELTVANDVLQEIVVHLNYDIKPDEAIGYLGNPDHIGYINYSSEEILCEIYMIWDESRLVLASIFNTIEDARKYCYVVGEERKIPASLPIMEVRYISHGRLAELVSPRMQIAFDFTGLLLDK
jgi:hypothetical protein